VKLLIINKTANKKHVSDVAFAPPDNAGTLDKNMKISIAILLTVFSVSCITQNASIREDQPPLVNSMKGIKENLNKKIRVMGIYQKKNVKSPAYIDCGFAKFRIADYIYKKGTTELCQRSELQHRDKIELLARVNFSKGYLREYKELDGPEWRSPSVVSCKDLFQYIPPVPFEINGKKYIEAKDSYYFTTITLLKK